MIFCFLLKFCVIWLKFRPPGKNWRGGTYWQIIADRALVDERDVPVRNIVILLGSRRNVPELLRVLLGKGASGSRQTNSGYRYQTRRNLCYSSWLAAQCPGTPPCTPRKRSIRIPTKRIILITGTKQRISMLFFLARGAMSRNSSVYS